MLVYAADTDVPACYFFKSSFYQITTARIHKQLFILSHSAPVSTFDFLLVLLTLTDRRATLGSRGAGGLLAPLVEQRVAGRIEILDLHLIVVHAHGG